MPCTYSLNHGTSAVKLQAKHGPTRQWLFLSTTGICPLFVPTYRVLSIDIWTCACRIQVFFARDATTTDAAATIGPTDMRPAQGIVDDYASKETRHQQVILPGYSESYKCKFTFGIGLLELQMSLATAVSQF